jgi:hypothetical protein
MRAIQHSALLVLLLLAGFTAMQAHAADAGPVAAAETPARREAGMAWFNEARFAKGSQVAATAPGLRSEFEGGGNPQAG